MISKGGVTCEGSMDHLATLLHGEYVLHEYVTVSRVVALSIYGSRSEVNGRTKLRIISEVTI